jgi:raffinose/stachyose/melibiose transport system permease protein
MSRTTVAVTSPVDSSAGRAARTRLPSRTSGPVGAAAHHYPLWFFIPAGLIFIVLFIVPTVVSFYFSLTRWTLFSSEFIGLENFKNFFQEPSLVAGLRNTFIYAVMTSGLKVILGMAAAMLLTRKILARTYLRAVVFFPVLVSTVGVGLTFQALMDPNGLINNALASIGISGPNWLVDPHWALFSVALTDVWKGLGLATVIYMAGIMSIPSEYYEAARTDGAGEWTIFRNIILPLSWPATSTVILLSLIGGLRTFDLIWAMTNGGPGFSSDVIGSVIYKQYQAGFYGLSTAGNVILFLIVTAIVFPLSRFLRSREVEQ